MPLALTILQHGATYHFTWQELGLAAVSGQVIPSSPPTLRLSTVQIDAQQQADLQQAIFAAAQIAQQLAALATIQTGRSTGAMKALERLGRMMFSQLLPPDLQAELRRLPPGTPLVLSTNDTQLPWELLHDDQHFLALHLAPSRQLLTATAARRNLLHPHERLHCLLIGDPNGDLPAAQVEIETLCDVLDSLGVQTELLFDTQATCARVVEELAVGHYDIIHYAGHARPGALHLADGWLESDKIHAALRGAPLIFLNACASLREQLPMVITPDMATPGELHYAGQGVTDLAAAFLLGGAQALIGTLWPIFDEGAQSLAVDFYRALLQGMPLGAALRHARERSCQGAVDTLIWSALALYGDPQVQFVRQSMTYRNSTALVVILPDPPVHGQAISNPATTQRIRRLVQYWSKAVQTTGGQVIMLTASRLVAIFGVPQAVEDDAERALLAALEFFRLCQESALDVLALGVASGSLLLEPLPAIPAATPFYWGSALTAAQQCAALAQPGQVVTTLATRRLTEHKFVFTPISFQAQDAQAADTPAFIVTPLPVPESPVTPAEPQRARPLIGRGEELAILHGYWQRVRRGQGKIVGIVGEAGIGKSRLVQSFQGACAADPHHWLAASGSLTTQETSYTVMRQLLRTLLQIEPSDQTPQIEQKISNTLIHLPKLVAWEQAGTLLQELLGLQQRQLTSDELQGRRNLQAQLLRTLLAQRAKSTPVVVVLENLHLVDSASLELLAQVTDGIQQLPILVLLVYRPGREHPWLVRQDQFQSLPLPALDRAAQVHLLQALLESVELPRNLPALLERTGGNPLFLEEALRSLQEEGVLVRQGNHWLLTRTWTDIQLPGTIQRILLARLDRQPVATRRALQVAALIDAPFTPALLGAVLGEEAVILETYLTRCDLLDVDWMSGAYTIRHPLIQEVAYQQLDQEDRHRWHRRVADHLARQPEQPTIIATVAHHYYYSHDRINAVRYGLRAMQQAAADWANQIALDWATRVLGKIHSFATQPLTPREQAHSSTSEEWTAWRLAALEQKGDVQATLGLNTEAITTYQLVLRELQTGAEFAIARQAALYVKLAEAHLSRSDSGATWSVIEEGLTVLNGLRCPELGQLIFWQALVQRRREQVTAALASSQQAATILHETGATRYLARTYTLQGMIYRALGREFYPQAIAVLEESMALSKADNYLPGLARASSSLGILYEHLGEWEKSLHYYGEGLQASAQSGNERQLATTYLDFSEIYRHQGKFDEAMTHAEQAQQMGEQLHFPDIHCVAHINLGLLYLRQQQLTAAAAHLQRAETLLCEHNLVSYQADLLNAQAELGLAQQMIALALDKAQSALHWAPPKGVQSGQLHRTLGLVYLAAGDFAAAAQTLTHSRELLAAEQNRYELAITLLAWAHYHQQGDEIALAHSVCDQAREIFSTLGAQFDAQRATTLLGMLKTTTN